MDREKLERSGRSETNLRMARSAPPTGKHLETKAPFCPSHADGSQTHSFGEALAKTDTLRGGSAMHHEIENAFSLDGRCAVITGAASGIGRQTAITLAQAGAHVVLADIDEAGLEETLSAVTAAAGLASIRPVDVTDRDDVEALAAF